MFVDFNVGSCAQTSQGLFGEDDNQINVGGLGQLRDGSIRRRASHTLSSPSCCPSSIICEDRRQR